MNLASKIELYANGTTGKRAVENLAHITKAIIGNITEGRTEEELEAAVFEQATVSLLSDFDAEISKHKQVRRFIDASVYTPFQASAERIVGTVDTLVGEQLLLAQPLPYCVLCVRRVVVDSDVSVLGATVKVMNGDVEVLSQSVDLVAGVNKIDLEVRIEADISPISVTVGIVSNGIAGFLPIQDIQNEGVVKRAATINIPVRTHWELVADMRKVADDYTSELADAFWYKCGIVVLSWHLKSQQANRSTIVGREELAANRQELIEEYKYLLKSAIRKIIESLEQKPVTRHDVRFDRGYQVGSLV